MHRASARCVPAGDRSQFIPIILVHNHPSGDPAPGARDRELTAQLRAASNLLMDSTARPRDCRQPQLLREHDPAAVNVFTRRKIQGSRVKVQWKSLVLE